MHRLLVESALLNEEAPVLPADAAKHLKVLRPKHGEEIELFDGKGRCRKFKVQSSKFKVECLIPVSETLNFKHSTLNLTLFACVTKGSRWDWTIEKATELGVKRIVPVISDRTIVRIGAEERAAKRERWARIAADAARQSDAVWLPEVTMPVTFAEALALVRETVCFVGALTEPPSPPLADALAAARGETAADRGDFAVFVGPEGDFTPAELEALLAIARPTSFGPAVLRAETAAIFAVSVVSAWAISAS